MFEQSILNAKPAKRTWSLAVSLVVQTSFIVLGLLIPLIYTDQLPGLSKWARNLVAPSPPPAALPPADTQTVSRRPASDPRVFTAPSHIPHNVPVFHDDLSQPRLEVDGVVGLPGPATMTSGIAQLLTNVAPILKPPEPTKPVRPPETDHAPIRVSQGVQEAKLLRKVIPVYPPLAIATRTQGTVHLVGVVAKDGTIRDLQVIDGHPLLVRAALDAVRQWIYKPTLLNNEPVEVLAPIAVTFTLGH